MALVIMSHSFILSRKSSEMQMMLCCIVRVYRVIVGSLSQTVDKHQTNIGEALYFSVCS